MSDDAQHPDTLQTDPLLAPPEFSDAGDGTGDFWANMDRAYDREFLHNLRTSRLHQRNVSFAAQQFQAQMLGLMLLGESEKPLRQDEECPTPEPVGPAADPTRQP
jgi:hypothetical protein